MPPQTPKSQPPAQRDNSETPAQVKHPLNAFTPTSVLKKMHKEKKVSCFYPGDWDGFIKKWEYWEQIFWDDTDGITSVG